MWWVSCTASRGHSSIVVSTSTSAKVSTFGSAVVDAFYVRGADGGKVTDSAAIQALEQALATRIAEAGDGSEEAAETTGRGSSSG